MMKNIFVISAIHHLIQVEAVVKEIGLPKKEVPIIFLTNETSKKTILEILKLFGYENYKTFSYWNFKEIFSSAKHSQYIQYLKSLKHCENLYISQYYTDYSLLAYQFLKPEKVYLLDEGTASFKVSKERKTVKSFDPKFLIKSLVYRRKINFPEKITYYTQYDFDINTDKDDVIKYQFTKDEKPIEFDQNAALILGSSVAEVGVVTKDNYMKIIKKIREKFNDKKVYYYQHRNENAEKLNEILKLGIEIIQSNIPFEFYYKSLNYTPLHYYSFYSPILDNISQQYKNLPKLNIIRFEKETILMNPQIVENIYESYLKNKNLHLISSIEL
ncbi:alpha-2,8-polysialyltransferase family protein [Chryseobacterium sp. SSA4.19]|uniref:alpha-2,8-polysialyltransferase family protein n=1 Tax=Chryseobacterium sp. SSA4.19 TaxID=2919915 RepID=UPI001F4F0973|nr:alpha-2,8-polysialyltransferase family protein [Chryseobacterium sp. SSA4.19]MCJ8152362.1 alpha-2,8-polysialyltransferase family protein [Chryseobacterium sp. SSA4.19]